jgi:hypothetical protein
MEDVDLISSELSLTRVRNGDQDLPKPGEPSAIGAGPDRGEAKNRIEATRSSRQSRKSSEAGTHPSNETPARHMPGRRSSFLGADTNRRRQPSSSLFLRVRPVKAEGLGEEYRHLDAGQRVVGAEVTAATAGRDSRGIKGFDVLEAEGAEWHIAKGRGPRRG